MEENNKQEKKFRMSVFDMLKECPKGMELYSLCFGNVKLEGTTEASGGVIITKQGPISYFFCWDGSVHGCGEPMLRPAKNQRDWRKFRIPFKDGDIVAFTLRALSDSEKMITIIVIFKGWDSHGNLLHHGYVREDGSVYVPDDGKGRPDSIAYDITCDRIRHATNEEADASLDTFLEEGYIWNAHYKTLVPRTDDAEAGAGAGTTADAEASK